MIEIRGIKKTYRMGENLVHALRGVDLRIEDGDFVAIMGPSGSGKSTLAHILGLLDVPSEGSYRLNGKEVAQLSEDELAVLRRGEIGFVFQQFNLLPRMNAFENARLPVLYSKIEGGEARAGELLTTVGLGTRTHHRPNEMSGGQQQRVAIARALVNRPRVVLADEPTGNLDSQSEREIMAALKDLNAQGITIIIVTHEEEIGAQASRLIRMRDGQIQSDERKNPLSSKNRNGTQTVTATATETGSGTATGSGTENPLKPQTAPSKLPTPTAFGFADILEYFRQGYRTLAANKVRTALSMLGILIGVAAVVAMLALGRGAQTAIEDQLSSLGSNLLVLRTGSVRTGGVAGEAGAVARLALDDADLLKQGVPAIADIAPSVNGRVQATYANRNWNTRAQGTTVAFVRMKSWSMARGRFFTEDDITRRSRVAVLGLTVARELFGDQSPVGEMIKLNKVNFQVVGVLAEKGSSGFQDQDDTIVVPISTAMYRLLGKQYIDNIDIQIRSPEEIASAQDQILELLYANKRVAFSQRESAFDIRNMAEIQQALSESSRTMSVLLSAIAAISLLVGGIGIMNIMLVSVTERTKEIGLRKAIGARRVDILFQFLAESVVVSVIGGLAGIAVGWGISASLSFATGWATQVSVASVALAFFFSVLIGVVFGIYPARQASFLAPIDALRYE